MDATPDTRLDTVVIGAGQAGLALAHYLRRDGRRFVVLEAADRVGDSWRRRWDSLTLFTPRRYDALPGMRFPGDPEGYPSKDEVADYLDAYASQFNLPIRLGRRVTSVRRDGAGGFVVDTRKETFHARQVVVATGGFTGPVIPGFAGRLGADVVQLHSSAYRNPGSVPEGEVVVVGAGNTGVQIASELAAAGRSVSLSVSTLGKATPQRFMGRSLFWWFERLGFMTAGADSRIARRLKNENTIIGSRPQGPVPERAVCGKGGGRGRRRARPGRRDAPASGRRGVGHRLPAVVPVAAGAGARRDGSADPLQRDHRCARARLPRPAMAAQPRIGTRRMGRARRRAAGRAPGRSPADCSTLS